MNGDEGTQARVSPLQIQERARAIVGDASDPDHVPVDPALRELGDQALVSDHRDP
jgi:DNA-directed RNA polymerase subunit K/omega